MISKGIFALVFLTVSFQIAYAEQHGGTDQFGVSAATPNSPKARLPKSFGRSRSVGTRAWWR
jgi:hypothetical protein